MRLRVFAGRFGDLSDEEFLARFPFPFLLENSEELEDEGERRAFVVLNGTPGSTVAVGRAQRNHVPIRDTHVSARHAELLAPASPAESWMVVDRRSTNKTFVEGEELTPNIPAPIEDGQTLAFGPSAGFVFLHAPSFLRELRARFPDGVPPEVAGKRRAETTQRALPRMSSDTPAFGDLLLVCEPLDPVPLAVGQRLRVGREEGHAELVLYDRMISRVHAEIERRPDAIYVRDLESANGTFIGARKVGPDWVRLEVNQPVTLGPYQAIVQEPLVRPARGGTQRHLQPVTRPIERLSSGIRGDLAETPLATLLEQIESLRDSGILEIEGQALNARVTFAEGRPLQAHTSTGEQGRAAIRRLLEETSGTYCLQRLGKREIDESFSEIMLERFLATR